MFALQARVPASASVTATLPRHCSALIHIVHRSFRSIAVHARMRAEYEANEALKARALLKCSMNKFLLVEN